MWNHKTKVCVAFLEFRGIVRFIRLSLGTRHPQAYVCRLQEE